MVLVLEKLTSLEKMLRYPCVENSQSIAGEEKIWKKRVSNNPVLVFFKKMEKLKRQL